MKVAAYQAPLASCRTMEALGLIREQVDRCESIGVEILCCPEGVLGGLADNSDRPTGIAISVDSGQLNKVLAPLASDTVTTILGFTEVDRAGHLYNSAAVFQRGAVIGVYRKLHPAINRSIYTPGQAMPVFTVGALTFGILICRDSTYPEAARVMAALGATALFVPSNNGMAPAKGGPELIAEALSSDIARAMESGVSVIRADVAGRTPHLVSHGSTGIVDQHGTVLGSARPLASDLVVADINVTSCVARRP